MAAATRSQKRVSTWWRLDRRWQFAVGHQLAFGYRRRARRQRWRRQRFDRSRNNPWSVPSLHHRERPCIDRKRLVDDERCWHQLRRDLLGSRERRNGGPARCDAELDGRLFYGLLRSRYRNDVYVWLSDSRRQLRTKLKLREHSRCPGRKLRTSQRLPTQPSLLRDH
jgi:hypothetical protein